MQLAYNNKFKPQRNSFLFRVQKNATKLSLLVVFLVLGVLLLSNTSLSSATTHVSQTYTKLHGYYKSESLTKSVLIFPSVEHAALLRELGVEGLFESVKTPQGLTQYVLPDAFDQTEEKLNSKMDPEDTTNQLLKAKKSFLDHGKQKFDGPHSPEIVLVTAIDFEKYELSHLTKIVQNRVNYAQKKKYGVYVRWTQEFLPMLSETNADKHWAKLYLLRSAMYAFPDAKYFWYLDQDALVMRYDIDLIKYLLEPKVLDDVMLRDQPLIPPNGIIKTYKNSRASSTDLILTQVNNDLNLDSFVLKNSLTAKALLEFWNDNLFKRYQNFPKFEESALTHILQWHPSFLSHTALVPPRTIASLHTAMELTEGNDIHYSKGDFVVNMRDCAQRKSCKEEIDNYWAIVENMK